MPKTEFKMRGEWKRFSRAIDPKRLETVSNKNISNAIKEGSMTIQKEIRENIRSGSFKSNADFTKLLKGSTKPLVGSGSELWRAVNYKMEKGKKAFIGIMKNARSIDGEDLFKIAVSIHEGANIRVTTKMRNMFLLLYQTSMGRRDPGLLRGRVRKLWDKLNRRGIIKPLRPGTSVIRIPSRPFIKSAFEDKGLYAKIKQVFTDAINEMFRV